MSFSVSSVSSVVSALAEACAAYVEL